MFKKIVGLGFSTKGKKAKDLEKYIESLVKGGATEFFTGYNPSYWSDKFGFEVSPNGRFSEHEQITDFDTLKLLVEEVHKYKLEIVINLNAWYYTNETFPLIQKMVEEFTQIGVDGIICGNISILEYLKEIKYKGKVNISTIMAVYNSEAIRFLLENYNINKVILSRELTLKEIEVLVTEFSETKFEVFGEGDFCRYNNGLCFAEHKYGSKDICTVVVNDLIIKKRFRPDFKKFILDEALSNEEKTKRINDEYHNIFEEIENILNIISLGLADKEEYEKRLLRLILLSKNRIDLYFDAMQPINSKRNKVILTYLKAIKYILNSHYIISDIEDIKLEEVKLLEEEIEKSMKSGIEYLTKKTKEIGGFAKLKAQELGSFYARSDNLNLYTYLFFAQFKNIETVKFPTRGRSYNEKLKVIEDVLLEGELDKEKYLNRGISIERAHYDLTYLFGYKLWFRKILNELS